MGPFGTQKRASMGSPLAALLGVVLSQMVSPLETGFAYSGLPSDSFAEMYNFLDGDSFGIGPMHEFVYGWQAVAHTMSARNNAEVRKRAGRQRFALAGVNGITLLTHLGVTEVMMNGTRTYCFGGVSRPPAQRSVICKGDMYQESRFTCKIPYLRYPSAEGYKYCIDQYAAIDSIDGSFRTAYCARGESVPMGHYQYICERREVHILEVSDDELDQRPDVARNPVVRRAEYYRAPQDILDSCPDWYACDIRISPGDVERQLPVLSQDNATAFVSHGGRYWQTLFYTQLATYATYFQNHADHPPQSDPAVDTSNKGGVMEQLVKANIGPNMNLQFNLNGIYTRHLSTQQLDLMRNDLEVQPLNFRTEHRESEGSDIDLTGGWLHKGEAKVSKYQELHERRTRPKLP